jgi:uncharacterized protein (TIGR02147 family)
VTELNASFFKFSDFREVLRWAYDERKERRKSYSIRAFARDLGIKDTTLGGVLRGRYGISAQTAKQFSLKLKFNKRQTEFFVALVESQHARTKIERESAKETLRKFDNTKALTPIDPASYSYLEKWFYPAALEAISVHGPKISSLKLAQVLKISEKDAKAATQVLLSLKLIEETPAGYVRTQQHLEAEAVGSSSVLRNFHKQMLEIAKEAIEQQPLAKRKNLSTTFSIESSRVENARAWLEKMHQKFIDEFASNGTADKVYACSSALFQLDYGAEAVQ